MFEVSAGEILTRTNPYLVAVACEPHNLNRSRTIVDFMIGAHEAHQRYGDATWAYNLRFLEEERRKRKDKKAEYRFEDENADDLYRAIQIDSDFIHPRNNLFDFTRIKEIEKEIEKGKDYKQDYRKVTSETQALLFNIISHDPRVWGPILFSLGGCISKRRTN
jgi:hypothetical protein